MKPSGPLPPRRKYLDRRKRLKPGNPPVRRTPMRRTALEPRSPRRVATNVRGKLVKRAGKYCEIGRPGCAGRGSQVQHRIPQGAGGVHGLAVTASDRLSNLLRACWCCHDWITDHPNESSREFVGWTIRHGENPAAVPVCYRGQVVYLDDEGGVHGFEAVGP